MKYINYVTGFTCSTANQCNFLVATAETSVEQCFILSRHKPTVCTVGMLGDTWLCPMYYNGLFMQQQLHAGSVKID